MGGTSGVRSVEQRVSYGLGHRIRIEVLCLLHEATYSVSELAKLTHQPLTTISHHIKELLASGCIELARAETVRNTVQHFYRAVKMPTLITDEEAQDLPPEEKQEYAALVLQGAIAEGLDALWAEKLSHDPRVCMMWRWFNLDVEGREELAQEQRESWGRINEIEAKSTARRLQSEEEPKTMIAVSLGFERNRPMGTAPPATSNAPPQGKTE